MKSNKKYVKTRNKPEYIRDFDITKFFEACDKSHSALSRLPPYYLEEFDKPEQLIPDEEVIIPDNIWEQVKRALTPTEFQVLYLIIYMGMPQREIIKHLNIKYSQTGVHKIYERAKRKLKNVLCLKTMPIKRD